MKKNSTSQKSNSRAPNSLLKKYLENQLSYVRIFAINSIFFFCIYEEKNLISNFVWKPRCMYFVFFLHHCWAAVWQVKNTISQKKSEVNILCSEQIKGKQCFDSIRKDSLVVSEKWPSNYCNIPCCYIPFISKEVTVRVKFSSMYCTDPNTPPSLIILASLQPLFSLQNALQGCLSSERSLFFFYWSMYTVPIIFRSKMQMYLSTNYVWI